MNKVVVIAEKSSRIVGEYPISFLDARSDKEYLDMAWQHAIDDGKVDPNKRHEYMFSIRGA